MLSTSKVVFKDYNPKENLLFPPNLSELIDEKHPVKIVLDGFQYLKIENLSNPGTGGGSEGLLASETGHALERMAFTVDDEPVVALGPMGVKTADLQFFPTSEGFYDYIKISIFTSIKIIWGT